MQLWMNRAMNSIQPALVIFVSSQMKDEGREMSDWIEMELIWNINSHNQFVPPSGQIVLRGQMHFGGHSFQRKQEVRTELYC